MKHERPKPDDEFPPLTKRQLAELEESYEYELALKKKQQKRAHGGPDHLASLHKDQDRKHGQEENFSHGQIADDFDLKPGSESCSEHRRAGQNHKGIQPP